MPSDLRMDPHRPPPHSLKRKNRSPSPPSRSPDIQHSPSTSLPSIRQLHPYLPPPGPHLPQPPYADEQRYYHHPSSSSSAPPFQGGPVTGGPRYAPHSDLHPPTGDVYAQQAADSEPEGDPEQENRPKQKRRRQALSCTECKRRKIKCDRAHPCGPCSRRGDQLKCQWHVIEPVDKYVSRAEFDEVKARLNHLEGLISRLPPSLLAASDPSPIPGSSASIPASAGYPSLHPSAVPSSSSSDPRLPYPPFSNPSPNQPSQSRIPYPDPQQPYSPYRPPPRPPSSSGEHAHSHTHSPPFGAQGKPSPLSLSAITAPFNVSPQQPKNCRAQTFTPLGERLRPEATVLQGPAAFLFLIHILHLPILRLLILFLPILSLLIPILNPHRPSPDLSRHRLRRSKDAVLRIPVVQVYPCRRRALAHRAT